MGRVCCVACGVCDVSVSGLFWRMVFVHVFIKVGMILDVILDVVFVSVSGLSRDIERTEIRPRSDLGR